MKLKSYHLQNYRTLPQISRLSPEQLEAIDVVGRVLPFKTNNYVVEQLINWENPETDPMFQLTFPQRGMLSEPHYEKMKTAMYEGDRNKIKLTADQIRLELNPHPASQMEHNIPELYGQKVAGIQHKYRETVLFFPSQGQTCHAYCTFCFRWPQFVGLEGLKFAAKQGTELSEYLTQHPEVSDLLLTGGDPMIMKAEILGHYLEPLLKNKNHGVKHLRIGSKALAYWPFRFLNDPDVNELQQLFKQFQNNGIHVTLMAHFSHPIELATKAVKKAIGVLREWGITIRTQSPLLRHINDDPDVWATMWREQVKLGCIPYYMFLPRDTGAKEYFAVALEKAWTIFRKAYQQVSGICRTVRGPSMSCDPGKVQVLGISKIFGKKYFVLRMLQGRDPDWVARPFFAEYKKDAFWLDDLKPAFGQKKFFFEESEFMVNNRSLSIS